MLDLLWADLPSPVDGHVVAGVAHRDSVPTTTYRVYARTDYTGWRQITGDIRNPNEVVGYYGHRLPEPAPVDAALAGWLDREVGQLHARSGQAVAR